MTYRIAIVEDEEREYKALNEHLKRYSNEKGVNFDIQYFPDAVNFVSDYQYNFDLIFMDIMMPDLDGIKAAERLRKVDKNVQLFFITNMAQYAIQGYAVSARYYLLKPVVYSDFALKLENTLTIIEKQKNDAFLMLNLPREKRKIYVKDIKYVEIFAHDVIFHTYDEKIHVRGTLSEFEEKLNTQRFCRINSCYLVNLSCITAVKNMNVYIDDVELRISYSRKKTLMKMLADFAATGR